MPTDKGLPGNPYSTSRNAWNDGDTIEETVMEEGPTDATLITSAIMALRDAVMALAHEQRTANLIAVTVGNRHGLTWDGLDIVHEVETRLGLDEETHR